MNLYGIRLFYVVRQEQLVEDTLIPQYSVYRASITRGPFDQAGSSMDQFFQKRFESPIILEWPEGRPDLEPIQLMDPDKALQELLKMIQEATKKQRQ